MRVTGAHEAMTVDHGICQAPDLEALVETLAHDEAWQHIDDAGRRWCRFVIHGDNADPTSGWAVESPPGTTVPAYAYATTRVEIVVRGSYEINGHECGTGTVTIIPANHARGPVEFGDQGGTILEILADPDAAPSQKESVGGDHAPASEH